VDSSLIGKKLPEEQELDAKLAELALLQDQLADKELELATLESTLNIFNQNYLKAVGRKYAELDGLEAEIAERLAAQNPADEEQAQKATQARQKANETDAAVQDALRTPTPAPKSDTLKKLYREAAKKMHPDYADDAADRKLREGFMARVNEAYRQGDEQALRDVLDEWNNSPETVKGQGVQADLVRTIRRIAQLRKRLAEIDERLSELMDSELSKLYAKFGQAEKGGRDLLQELAESIDGKISHALERLQQLTPSDAS
jgi:DnaJ-domain-containing protein 1